jgi:hypothetical protein
VNMTSYCTQGSTGPHSTAHHCRLLWILSACLAIPSRASAQQEPNSPLFDHYHVPVIPLSGHQIGDADAFGEAFAIAWVNGNLAIIDSKSDQAIVVMRASDGRIMRRFGRHGAGPGDFSGPWSLLVPRPARDEFWVFDVSLQRLTRVNLSEDFAGDAFRPKLLVPLANGAHHVSPQWLSSGRLVSSGFLPKGLMEVFDSAGKSLKTLGDFRLGDARIAQAARQQAYSLRLTTDPAGRKVVAYSHFSDRLEFIDGTGKAIGAGTRPFGFDPVFKVTGKLGLDAALTKDARYGYLGVKTTAGHLFALFSGRREGDYPKDDWMGRHVHVYGWDGKLQQVLLLDADIVDIAVDPSEHYLYAVRVNPLPGILVYSIPGVLRRGP